MKGTRVAVIGAGPGGLGLGLLLRRAGIEDFVIFDRAPGVGGTWRHNTYPGAACDVPSHLYSFSFLLNPHWTTTFAAQPEILAYFEWAADVGGLRPHLRLRTGVESATWDETTRHWCVRTDTGEHWQAQVVVSAVGMFNAPAIPDLPGLADFAGPVMHSARWDHEVSLTGKRVGVVGTGASAVQIVPAIAAETARVVVFQRSAPWIMPRGDAPIGAEDQQRFATDAMAARRHRHGIYRFYEANTLTRADDPKAAAFERYARDHLESAVADVDLRTRLTPRYAIGCKRILLSDDWYPTVQRSDVEVVSEPIERVAPGGILTGGGVTGGRITGASASGGVGDGGAHDSGGRHHDLDVLVLATGFHATDYLAGVEVVGRDGRNLRDEWRTEPRAYLGTTVPGFPNLFVFYGPNTNQGGNSILIILEAQARYVLQALATLDRLGADAMEVTPAAFDAYNQEIDDALTGTLWEGCGSYFRTASGHIATQLPHPSAWFRRRARRLDPGDYSLLG